MNQCRMSNAECPEGSHRALPGASGCSSVWQWLVMERRTSNVKRKKTGRTAWRGSLLTFYDSRFTLHPFLQALPAPHEQAQPRIGRRSKAHGDGPAEPWDHGRRATSSYPFHSPRRGRRNRRAPAPRAVRRSAAPFGGWEMEKRVLVWRREPTAFKASPWALLRRPIRGWTRGAQRAVDTQRAPPREAGRRPLERPANVLDVALFGHPLRTAL